MIIPKFIYNEIIKYKQNEARRETLEHFEIALSHWLMSIEMSENIKKELSRSLREWGLIE